MYNAAVAIDSDQSAQRDVTAYLNAAITATTASRQTNITFNTTDLATILNKKYSGLTITTAVDLTTAYKAQLITALQTGGYIVSTLGANIIIFTFP
jgi:hypothetical protein